MTSPSSHIAKFNSHSRKIAFSHLSLSLFLSLSLSLKGLMSITATTVKVNRALSVPPVPFDLPLVADPTHTVTVSPPAAHIGLGPVQMRLISYELREGQVHTVHIDVIDHLN